MRCALASAAGLPDLGDLLEDLEVAAGQERAPVDDHVDLVGAGLDGVLGVGELDVHRGPAAGERRRDRGDFDAAAAQRVLRGGDHVGVDADRRRGGAGRVGGVGAHGLRGERAHLALGVLALERGQVDHRDREVEGVGLGRRLDGPGAERGGALLGADLVDPGQPVQEAPQRRVGPGDVEVTDGSPRRRRCPSRQHRLDGVTEHPWRTAARATAVEKFAPERRHGYRGSSAAVVAVGFVVLWPSTRTGPAGGAGRRAARRRAGLDTRTVRPRVLVQGRDADAAQHARDGPHPAGADRGARGPAGAGGAGRGEAVRLRPPWAASSARS